MKSLFIFPFLIILFAENINAQDNCIDKYLNHDPSRINNTIPKKQEYSVTLKWQNLDALSGTVFNCNIVNAEYHIESDTSVSWKDVNMATVNDFKEVPKNSVNLGGLSGFSYKPLSMDFLQEDFYEDINPSLRDLAKWLVSDAIQMQGLAWYVFDSLEFNKEFYPELLNNYDIEFENWVSFSSRYQMLEWSAITKYSNEICAVIKFESLYNPVKADTREMSFKGRSLYYGELWISLSDKEVEYARMIEDVVMNLEGNMFPDGQLIDLQREIVFEKIR